ncbi:MAG: pilus assembly protein TadE [Pauljensenia sp.]
MVTVELALGFIVVAVVLALVLGVVAAGSTRASLCQAVREVAREASVGGEDPAGMAPRSFGPGARVAVSREGRWVEVVGHAELTGPGAWVGMTASCSVRTLVEGGVP